MESEARFFGPWLTSFEVTQKSMKSETAPEMLNVV